MRPPISATKKRPHTTNAPYPLNRLKLYCNQSFEKKKKKTKKRKEKKRKEKKKEMKEKKTLPVVILLLSTFLVIQNFYDPYFLSKDI